MEGAASTEQQQPLEINRRQLFINKRKTEVLIRMAALGAQEEDLAFLRDLFSSSAASSAPSSLINSPSPLRRNSLVVDFPGGGAATTPTSRRASLTLASAAAAAFTPPPPAPPATPPPPPAPTPANSKEYTDLMSYFQIEYAPTAKSSHRHHHKGTSPAAAAPVAPDQEEEEDASSFVLMNPTKESWVEFDVFDYAGDGGVVTRMGEALLARHGFTKEFAIPTATLRGFLGLLESTYLEVPYHNSTHGADVAHVMSYFLLHCNLAQRGDSLMHFASLIAALGHDVGHPGFSNRFLVHTDDALAITFNDKSPLENMHASTVFQILHTHDILHALSKDDKRRFRQYVIEMILATDNAVHADVVAKIDDPSSSSGAVIADLHVFQASLHAADLSGGGKTVHLSQQWTSRLLQEFYMQGDLERELELYDVLPVMDRNSTLHRGVFQDAFIKQICIPLYRTLQDKCQLDLSLALECFESNARHWGEEAAQKKKKTEEEEETAGAAASAAVAVAKTVPGSSASTKRPAPAAEEGSSSSSSLSARPQPTAPSSSSVVAQRVAAITSRTTSAPSSPVAPAPKRLPPAALASPLTKTASLGSPLPTKPRDPPPPV